MSYLEFVRERERKVCCGVAVCLVDAEAEKKGAVGVMSMTVCAALSGCGRRERWRVGWAGVRCFESCFGQDDGGETTEVE